ncbi:MAG: hypothetical protein NVS2B8_09950 [Vulcanimicrobiaceae bacterium]
MSERPKILVTNDDGVESAGIVALAEALRELGDVTVVAPDRDNSGVGHSISIHHPVRVHAIADRAVPTFACSGTPADCVVLGAFDLCGGTPSLVVSGVNRGANAGDDINYSGTVAAACEGLIIGIPAIAVSLAASWPERAAVQHWDVAAGVAETLARDDAAPAADVRLVGTGVDRVRFHASSVPRATRGTLNSNVPSRDRDRIGRGGRSRRESHPRRAAA